MLINEVNNALSSFLTVSPLLEFTAIHFSAVDRTKLSCILYSSANSFMELFYNVSCHVTLGRQIGNIILKGFRIPS